MPLELDKYDIIKAVRLDSSRCSRTEAYHYISTGLFTKYELVEKYRLLTNNAYQHILTYSERRFETEPLPDYTLEPENQIISGNVDVLFFGVCGSGGKTCLMASIMTLIGDSPDFLYQEYVGSEECNNSYGAYLAKYMDTNILPPRTDSYYINVVNTLINNNNKTKGVSFVEFAGEELHALAFDGEAALSPSLVKILNNGNKKILFFTLDPTLSKDIFSDGFRRRLNQANVLSSVISYMDNKRDFINNVVGLHLIVSKSDRWLHDSMERSLNDIVNKCDAGQLFLQIKQLVEKYNINSCVQNRVDPIPFSIGKFMMGGTYEFDTKDALKVFQIIKDDLESVGYL